MGFLTKKYGPLPGWGWLALSVVAFAAFLYWRSKQTASQTSTLGGDTGQTVGGLSSGMGGTPFSTLPDLGGLGAGATPTSQTGQQGYFPHFGAPTANSVGWQWLPAICQQFNLDCGIQPIGTAPAGKDAAAIFAALTGGQPVPQAYSWTYVDSAPYMPPGSLPSQPSPSSVGSGSASPTTSGVSPFSNPVSYSSGGATAMPTTGPRSTGPTGLKTA